MKRTKLVTLLLLTSVVHLSMAQTKLPVIKANSVTVDIKEGENLNKGVWTISPKINPDIYYTSAKVVTFYTDLSSISFKIDPKVGEKIFLSFCRTEKILQ